MIPDSLSEHCVPPPTCNWQTLLTKRQKPKLLLFSVEWIIIIIIMLLLWKEGTQIGLLVNKEEVECMSPGGRQKGQRERERIMSKKKKNCHCPIVDDDGLAKCKWSQMIHISKKGSKKIKSFWKHKKKEGEEEEEEEKREKSKTLEEEEEEEEPEWIQLYIYIN